MAKNGWTEERKQKQSEAIKNWKPWKKGGVKTEAGKNISRMNAQKNGFYSAPMHELKKTMSQQKKTIKTVKSDHSIRDSKTIPIT